MAGQRAVHHPVEAVDVAGVLPELLGREQRDGRPRTGAESRQVAVAPGAALAPARGALVGIDAYEGGVQRLELGRPPRLTTPEPPPDASCC